MKLTYIILVLLFMVLQIKAQDIIVDYVAANAAGSRLVKRTNDAQATAINPLLPITIRIEGLPAGTNATANAQFNNVPRSPSGTSPNFTLSPLSNAEVASYTSYNILVSIPDGSVTYQNVAQSGTVSATLSNQQSTATSTFPTNSALQEIGRYFPALIPTDFGLRVSSTTLGGSPYIGNNYSHIFLDQFGNSLLGAIPQGISNRQYVVHIIYLTNGDRPSQISYSINQTKGTFNPSLLFNNAGQLGTFGTQGTIGGTTPISYVWAHQEFLLRTSTDNIEFEISRNILDIQGLLSLQSTLVAKHTIEMSKVFHGSFDIGLISTNLSNPTFQLVSSINDPNQTVIKQSENGNRGILTAMATFYTSPIVLLEKYLLNSDIPNYKLTGRNFLDDHKIYERIFPAVGVSITDRAFKNLFFGLNWELARGASVFAGIHYGEVNTFRTDSNFKFEETVINEAEFNLRSNKQWKQGYAIGVNLDLLVVTNLLRR